MKKIICTIIVFAFLANVSAQLNVDATGQVGTETASPQYELEINENTRVTGDIYPGEAVETKDSTGIIIAYSRCPTAYDKDSKITKIQIGIYIKDTDTKEVFLATNIPDSKIADLLGAPVETLKMDLEVMLPTTIPVAFSYRKSTESERVYYPCLVFWNWAPKFDERNQIIVSDIQRRWVQ